MTRIRSTSMCLFLLCVSATLAACGGTSGGGGSTTPVADDDGGGGGGGARPEPGEVLVPPETMDEIQRMFDRKRPAVSRCLTQAIDAKELPKSARGKVTLNVVVSPQGKATDIKVVKATIESKQLTDCVIHKVQEIVFPELPKPFPTSYTYAFEAT